MFGPGSAKSPGGQQIPIVVTAAGVAFVPTDSDAGEVARVDLVLAAAAVVVAVILIPVTIALGVRIIGGVVGFVGEAIGLLASTIIDALASFPLAGRIAAYAGITVTIAAATCYLAPTWLMEVVVAVGWLLAVWMFVSTLFAPASYFSDGWRSKLIWFLLSLAAFIPYLGIAVVLAYVAMERANFPETESSPARPGMPRGPVGNRYPPVNYSYSPAVPRGPRVCGSCGGSGTYGSCSQCQGGWVRAYNGSLEHCHAGCMGGRLRCGNCGGRGQVSS
jgi:hypothetical protein